MSDVTLQFTGKCPKVVPRPIPLQARSMKLQDQDAVFNPTAVVSKEEADYLLSLGTAFKLANQGEDLNLVAKPPKGVVGTPLFHPEKWKTREEAQAFLDTELGGAGKVRQVGRIFKINMNDHEV